MIWAGYRYEADDDDATPWPIGTNPRVHYQRQTAAQRAAWEANRDELGLPVYGRRGMLTEMPAGLPVGRKARGALK